MMLYLFLTALTVSIDSFICGFSLALSSKKKLPLVFIIAFTVFLMCLTTNYLAVLLADKITQKSACVGGFILIGVGLYNIFKKSPKNTTCHGSLYQAIIAGFAVGLDGALANLSLALMGISAFYVPVIIALTHAFTITLGISLAKTRIAEKFAKIEILPPLILILLGVYKLLGLFI